ncbi:MAG: zinc ribbon domain-containing protein [Bacilli bacterium]|nr:zinc ribbon domain-containing protein [Bacilli bacterium]
MKCTNCYCEVKETDIYCKNCGQEIKREEKSVVEFSNPKFKRRNSHPWLIVGIIVFLMLAAFIGTIIFFIKYDEEHPTETYNTNEQIDKRENKKTKQVKFNSYTFTVPSDLETSSTDDKLFIYGKNNIWVGVVMMQEGKYETILEAKDQIKTLLSNQSGAQNYDMTNAVTEEKDYNGKNFLITRNIKSGSYSLDVSYGKADENNIYVISVTKSDGTELEESERETMYSAVATGIKDV